MDDFRNTTERLFIDADGNTRLEVLYTNDGMHMVQAIMGVMQSMECTKIS